MTYTPINWQTGDTITAEKMNNFATAVTMTVSPIIPLLQTKGYAMSKVLITRSKFNN